MRACALIAAVAISAMAAEPAVRYVPQPGLRVTGVRF